MHTRKAPVVEADGATEELIVDTCKVTGGELPAPLASTTAVKVSRRENQLGYQAKLSAMATALSMALDLFTVS